MDDLEANEVTADDVDVAAVDDSNDDDDDDDVETLVKGCSDDAVVEMVVMVAVECKEEADVDDGMTTVGI